MPVSCVGAETSGHQLLVTLGHTNTARDASGPVLPRLVQVLGLMATHSSSLIITQRRHFLPSTRLEPSSLARQLSPLVFQPAGFSAISFSLCQTTSAGSILSKLICFQKAISCGNCKRGSFWNRQRKRPKCLSLDHSPVFDIAQASGPHGQTCRVFSRSQTELHF